MKTQGGRGISILTLGLAAFAVAEGVHAAPEKLGGFSEVVLGPTPETVMAIVSPDGRHAAYAAPSGAKRRLFVDGRPGPEFDGELVEYLAGGPSSVVFSADGERVACTVRKGDESWVIVDGKPGRHYRKVGAVVFSPDSQHVAYPATTGP